MSRQDDFREALIAGDVRKVRKMWATAFPHLPAPATYELAEISMHMARTVSDSIPLNVRAYSHRWLCERDLPSQLPDKLKPAAERLYPTPQLAVGISLNFRDPFLAPAAVEIRGEMELAVLDVHADGKIGDAALVTARMQEAKAKAKRALFGR